MGNQQSIQKLNYEDIQYAIQNKGKYLLINTLPIENQQCLILNTLPAIQEEEAINKLFKNGHKDAKIIIYGKNANDDTIYTKYNQLYSLGFYNIYIYPGGIFEWLLLQDIYGLGEFQTTTKELDILKYKSNKILNIPLLEY
jgi:rhodanese-related sulfurtransferase